MDHTLHSVPDTWRLHELLLQAWLKWHVNVNGKCDGAGLLCILTVQRNWFTHPAVCCAGILNCTMKSSNSADSGEISRLRWKHGLDTQFFSTTGNTSEIATLQCHIKGIGALKFRCADRVYTDDRPMPPWDSVCKAEFWTSSKYVDFRSHLARPRNSFDIASSEGNVVHLKIVSGSGADATGGESPFQLCLLNPTTILNATVVGLPFILAVIEVPKGWSMGLPPLAVRHVSMGKPLVVAGELADVRIIMSQLQTDLAEEGVNQVSVMVYNTGSRSPNFTMMQSVMTIVTLTPIPRKVHFPL